MREVSASLEAAITSACDYRIGTRLTVYKSRAYFDAFTSAHPIAEAKPAGYTGNPISEAIIILTGTPEYAITPEILTVYVNDSGHLCLVREGKSAIVLSGPITVSNASRVGIVQDNGSYFVFYHDGSSWLRRTIDLNLLLENDPECTVDEEVFSTLGQGAIYPLTMVTAVIFDINEGAVRVSYIDSDGLAHSSKKRFFNPIVSMTDTDEFRYALHKTGAVWVGNKIWAYYTNYKGAVLSICYLTDDEKNGVWSEIRTAIPEDLCNMDIGNVIKVNERIFICGKFYRQEEFESTYAYTLLSWSDDGITFTMNRRVLCSLMNYRFMVAVNDRDVVFSTANRIARMVAPYQVLGEETDKVEVDVTGVTGSVSGELSMGCRSGAEEYFGNQFIDTGAYAKLELTQNTTGGTEFIKYHDMVVSGIQTQIRDGMRGYQIMLQTDGVWHTSNMSQPFYMEFQGNQAIYDPCDDMRNLVRATVGVGPSWTLSMDFWNSDGTNPDVRSHEANTTDDCWTAELNTKFADYPVLPDVENITIKLYGWSRAGLPYPESGSDPTPVDTLNDKILALLQVEDENGTNLQYVSTVAQAVDEITNWPQTYFPEGARAGNYPLVFTMPNPGAGKKIIKLGMRVSSHSGATVYYLERVEIPEVAVEIISGSDEVAAFADEVVDIGLLTDVTPASDPVPSFTPRIAYIYEGAVPWSGIESPHNWYQIWMKVKNETDLPITGVKAFAKCEVLTSSGNYVQASSSLAPSEWQQEGDTFLHESAPITIAPGEIKSVSITTSHSNGPTGSASVRVRVWFEYEGQTTLSKKQGTLVNKKKGIPQLLFTSRPYSAYNFEQTARYKIVGDYSQAGLIGFATDKKNFTVGYIKNGKAIISRFRDGVEKKLTQADYSFDGNKTFDIRFWHRDGMFGLEWKLANTNTWPDRGSQLKYKWKEVDGALAKSDDIFHIGAYSNIDPPRFRITGFKSEGNLVGVLPIDRDPNSGNSDFQNNFPSAGVIDIQGVKYNYTGKIADVDPIVGPFGLRNINHWKSPYIQDPDGSYTFVGGNAIEFTFFRWLNGADHHSDYVGKIIAVNTGQTFLNDDTQWKSWITTNGVQEILKNRVRMYADDRPDWSPSTDDKVWVTNGLTGVSLVEVAESDYFHPEGIFCYFDSDDSITMYGYSGTNVAQEQNIRQLLDLFCRLSGTKANFLGDWKRDLLSLSDGELVNLYD